MKNYFFDVFFEANFVQKSIASCDDLIASDHLKRGRFSSTVHAKQTEALATFQCKTDTFHSHKAGVVFSQIVGDEHLPGGEKVVRVN